jgi:toxin ParE1/3/4
VAKPVQLRSLAVDDIDDAIEHYQREAGDAVAGHFIDALQRALTRIGRYPHSGSLRFAVDLDIPELRCAPLPRFPYAIFYREASKQIDVWRVLHTRRDILTLLTDTGDT